jgi:hypothetical protein
LYPAPGADAQQAVPITSHQAAGSDIGNAQTANNVEGSGMVAVLSVHPAAEAEHEEGAPGRMYSAQVLGSERLVQAPTFRSGRLSAAANATAGAVGSASVTRTSETVSQGSFSMAGTAGAVHSSRGPLDLASAFSLGQQQMVSATDLLRSLRAPAPGEPEGR